LGGDRPGGKKVSFGRLSGALKWTTNLGLESGKIGKGYRKGKG